jgi:N-acetylglucosamine-6-phosphate deacetylase
MSRSLFENARVVQANGSTEETSIVVVGELIAEIPAGTDAGTGFFDCSGLTLLPGFIDVHIHGAMGVDVNVADVDGLLEIGKFLARNGVTAWLPTLVPDSDKNYARVIDAIDLLMEIQDEQPVARAVGVHYEGVFANEKMCGALRPEYFKRFPEDQLSQLPTLNRGVHMTTFAPEVEGGIDLTRELVRQGWIASIGHTKADIEILDKAFESGATHLTHFYNAMTGLHHRDVGVVGWALTRPDVTFDIIADGVHVHPAMLEFACRAKGTDHVSLISDSISAAGMGDGEFDIWGEKISVTDGRTRNERGSIAGSVISMLDAVKKMRSLGFSDVEVSRMASGNPARLIGASNTGSMEIGKRADFVALDAAGNVKLTVVGGRVVFDGR